MSNYEDERKAKREEGKKEMRFGTKAFKYGAIGLILCGLIFGANWLALSVTAEGDFNKSVHGHIINAYWSSDPDTMESEINLAVQGMKDIGLESGMTSRYWSWEQTPDNSMTWQYKHFDSILDRCDEFREWIDAQDETSSQQFQDVYSQKLNNIRAFISHNDGGSWSDDIAHDAYLLKHYEFQVIWISMILTIVLPFSLTMLLSGHLIYTHGRKVFIDNGGRFE